jgi:L-arabinose transport system ATP-binding protein
MVGASPPPEQRTPAGRGSLLALRGICKRFGIVQALAEVGLDLQRGEVLALIGENGAGKSTLIRILEGVFPADQGAIEVDGAAVRFAAPSEAHRAGIRVIHQEPDIAPDLSVAENLFVGDLRRIGGVFLDRGDLARRTMNLLARFGLEASLSPWMRAGGLSPAQRQLVEIMRALRSGVRILALDEPTSSLTEEEARLLFVVVRQLKAEGVGIIYISHRMHEIRALADRIAVLRDGRMVALKPAAELSDEAILQLMVGRPITNLFDRSERRLGDVVLSVRGLATSRVRDVSFDIRAGEVVGMAGLMGAGRSEVAEAIFGHDPILAGAVSLSGRRLRLRSPADAIAAGIGFAPEDRKAQALLLLASVESNVTLCVPDLISRFGFVRAASARRVAEDQVQRLRIKTPHLDQLVSKLSGGNQQKVVLGRWLARRPKLLILDEPTRGIDVGAKAEIYRLVAQLASEGLAILIISSEMPELLGLSDRILVMAGGRLVGDLPREAADEDRILALAMTDNLDRIKAA